MKFDDVRMEDINGWVGEIIDKIEDEIEDNLDIDKLDELFESMSYRLEEFFNWPDYRKYN